MQKNKIINNNMIVKILKSLVMKKIIYIKFNNKNKMKRKIN